jgi:hypothetical protein
MCRTTSDYSSLFTVAPSGIVNNPNLSSVPFPAASN